MVLFNGKGSTIDVSPELLISEEDNKHISFYVGITVFSFSEGFAGKGHRFVVLKDCHTKAYL